MKACCVVCHDPELAADHPDWRHRDPDGTPRRTCCLNGAYVAKVIWPWMTQALADPACDQLEFEIPAAAAEPCWCPNCTQHIRDAGLDPADETVRLNHARDSVQRFKDETTSYAAAVRPGVTVVFL
jgi:hypothetical protein